jgi:hypothetical protein
MVLRQIASEELEQHDGALGKPIEQYRVYGTITFMHIFLFAKVSSLVFGSARRSTSVLKQTDLRYKLRCSPKMRDCIHVGLSELKWAGLVELMTATEEQRRTGFKPHSLAKALKDAGAAAWTFQE